MTDDAAAAVWRARLWCTCGDVLQTPLEAWQHWERVHREEQPAAVAYCCCIPDQSLLREGMTHEEIEAIGCQNLAEWSILSEGDPYDETQACSEHVGALLGDARSYYVSQIPEVDDV